jgi:hypothetical protein
MECMGMQLHVALIAPRQGSGVHTHRQVIENSVWGHRHARSTQCDAAPTHILAAFSARVTAAGSDAPSGCRTLAQHHQA